MRSVINWISCSERMPVDEIGDFLVIVKEQDNFTGKWNYHIDLACRGDYIDDFWTTCNDWCEGQEVHITHWAEISVPQELIEKEGKVNE